MNIGSSDEAWMFSGAATPSTHEYAFALARAGGTGGTTYLYKRDDVETAALGGPAQGSGFEAGGGSYSDTTTDGACLPPNTTKAVNTSTARAPRAVPLLTPPSSLSPPSAFRIPSQRPGIVPSSALPPSPASHPAHPPFAAPGSIPLARSDSRASSSSASSAGDARAAARCGPVMPLISSVFPYASTCVARAAHMLEIVTPPSHVLHGFVADTAADLGRVVFVHLPPTHASAPARPEHLTPAFSNVLRPGEEPRYAAAAPVPLSSTPAALDIRESVTALLDLADTLEGTHLVLILDKDERAPAPLAELLHALMYVGGTPVRPGAPIGDWEWDARRWALVSIEL